MTYKTIKSIAHNIGHSYLSGLNLDKSSSQIDPISTLLGRTAIQTNTPIVTLDFIAGDCIPSQFRSPTVMESLTSYKHRLKELLTKHRVTPSMVSSATMTITYFLEQYEKIPGDNWQLPYEAVVTIVDDRGISHEGHIKDSAHTSNIPQDMPAESTAVNRLASWIKRKLA